MTTFDELDHKLDAIRASLDKADDTKFAELGKLLDQVTKDTDAAIKLAVDLRATFAGVGALLEG